MNRKYLFGILGLVLGVVVGFTWTRSYNNNNAQTVAAAAGGAAGTAQPTGGAAGNSADQKAMMGDVAKTIDEAKNNPKDFEAQIKAATVYYQIGKFDETAQYLEKAYAVDPEKLTARKGLGFIAQNYFNNKNYTEAEKWFRLAIKAETETADKTEMQIVLAEVFMQSQPPQPDKAVTELQESLKLTPKNPHAVGHLVEAYALKKDARSAEDALSQLKAIEPQNPRIQPLETLVADVKAGRAITLPKE